MMSAAAGLGPYVTPLATFNVTTVCEDGEQTAAHKMISDLGLFLMLGELLKIGGTWWNCNRAGSRCKHPLQLPSVSWVLV